jgi:WD repeat-containing protein 35
MSTNSKSLCICYESGAMQLMSREDDPAPIILDVDMHVVSIKWNDNGSMLAVAGHQTTGDKIHNFIHFYSPWGEHLRSLKVTGKSIADCAWEAHSLRLVIAIDGFIYFANCRLDYKVIYINKIFNKKKLFFSGVIFKIQLFIHFIHVQDRNILLFFGIQKRMKFIIDMYEIYLH